jgi:hypothetical protein
MTGDTPKNLAPGQAWSFAGAPSEKARVVIGALDAVGDTDIVHVALVDVPPPPEMNLGRDAVTVSHMPFDRAAIEASLESYLGEEAAPEEFENGRADWKAALDAGEAGVFTITLAQALEAFYGAAAGGGS